MEHFPWWNEAQKKLAEEARVFTEETLIPLCSRCTWKNEYPWEALREIGKRGWFGALIPEEYGGRMKEWGVTGTCIVTEEISRAGGLWAIYESSMIGSATQLVHDGNKAQKRRWLPKMATGELIGAITMTEPFAGSDIASIETTAVRDGDFYIVNGKKRFQTGSAAAHLYMTYVKTSDNPEDKRKHNHLTGLIIEKGTPGFTVERVNDLMALDGIYNCYLNLDNVKVPVANRLGDENMGWWVMMKGLNVERITTVAGVLGGMREGLRYATQHLRRRVQFGATTGDIPTNQFKVADMLAKLSLARLSVYYAAYCADLGLDISVLSGAAKLFGTTANLENAIDAVQLMGGNGVTKYYPVEGLFRGAKLFQIASGTDEVLRLVLYRIGLKAMEEDLKPPVRIIDNELKVPVPLGKTPPRNAVSDEGDVLRMLAEDYRVNPGLHMTMDDLKGRMDVDDKDLNKHLLSLEKRGLASLYRDRRGEIALARATYKGLGASHPLEYYKYVPEWVDARDLF
jgi:alkylation response protein AidB-like acyl-CoA dehydrogenase